MLFVAIALLVVSVPVLGRAADGFVTAAARLSLLYRIPAVVVGAVVIGFGTSLPEMLASVLAAVDGSIDVAVGNVVGSNAANLTLVLGPAALLCPIVFPPPILRREVVLMLASSVAFALVLLDGRFTRLDGSVLLAVLSVAIWLLVRASSGGDAVLEHDVEEYLDDRPATRRVWLQLLVGLGGVVLGAYLLVWSATHLADRLGLTGGMVGVSLVAVGTSLPEMVTTYHAARRKEGELIVGNLLGSNVFNALLVGGASSLVGPGRVDPALAGMATWIMVLVTVAVALLAVTVRRVPRFAAPVLVAGYVGVLFAAV